MKTREQVNEAHDYFALMLDGDMQSGIPPLELTEGQKSVVSATQNVLCWILDCADDNEAFAKTIRELKSLYAQLGVERNPRPGLAPKEPK